MRCMRKAGHAGLPFRGQKGSASGGQATGVVHTKALKLYLVLKGEISLMPLLCSSLDELD